MRWNDALTKSFRRHIEQSRETSLEFGENFALLLMILRTIHEEHGNAQSLQLFHLIGHQRDQGRDDDGEPFQHQGRQLEAQAFARTRRHDANHIAALHHVLNDLALMRTKLGELEGSL